MDGSPPGSSVLGIFQPRALEWVAISFSNALKWKVKVKSLSRVQLLATPWTAAHQAPLSVGFSRQEYWSGVPLLFHWSLTISKKKKKKTWREKKKKRKLGKNIPDLILQIALHCIFYYRSGTIKPPWISLGEDLNHLQCFSEMPCTFWIKWFFTVWDYLTF